MQWKKLIKEKVNIAAFTYFKNLQQTHSKTKDIKYNSLEIQSYLKSPQFNDEECEILFKLRSKMHYYKCNMPSQYQGDLTCALQCSDTGSLDNQEHQLACPKLKHVLDASIDANIKLPIVTYMETP